MRIHVQGVPLCAEHTLVWAANTRVHAGDVGVWVCCVCTHMCRQHLLVGAARCTLVVCTPLHTQEPPREVWGCERGCSPLPSLTCPGHRLHRDPLFN